MITVELTGLILIVEYFLQELRFEAALEEIQEGAGRGDVSCPYSSFLFPFN